MPTIDAISTRPDRSHVLAAWIAVVLINALDPSSTVAPSAAASRLPASNHETSLDPRSERTIGMPTVPVVSVPAISTAIHPPLDVEPADRFGVAVAIGEAGSSSATTAVETVLPPLEW